MITMHAPVPDGQTNGRYHGNSATIRSNERAKMILYTRISRMTHVKIIQL